MVARNVRIYAGVALVATCACTARKNLAALAQVAAGEMFVVPRGVAHKPYAENEVKLLLIEPRGVPNTGHEGGERTAENDVWL